MNENDNLVLNFIDLCCGIGGFHQAQKNISKKYNINTNCVYAADIEKNCRDSYKLNYDCSKFPNPGECGNNLTDIVKFLDSPVDDDVSYLYNIKSNCHDQKIDCICAGFPCQPFSVGGNKKGVKDPRGTVIYDIFDIVRRTKPRFIILENVPGLLSNKVKDENERNVFEYIKNEMRDNDYLFNYRVLSPCDINIPQTRKRVIMVGIKRCLIDGKIISDREFNLLFHDTMNQIIKDRTKLNGNFELFEEDDTINKKFKINIPYNSFVDSDFDSISKDRKVFLNNQKKMNIGNIALDVIEDFVNMEEWDTINNTELKNILNKKCRKNIKQEHFFTDFLLYKNTNEIGEGLYPERKKRFIPNSIKLKCDMWNTLYENHEAIKNLIDTFLDRNREKISTLPFGFRYFEYCGGEDYGVDNKINDTYVQFRQSGVRIRKSNTFPTLVKSGPMPILFSKRRYLTWREGLRLQSFPGDFKIVDEDRYAMNRIGNAVNVQVIEMVLECVYKITGII